MRIDERKVIAQIVDPLAEVKVIMGGKLGQCRLFGKCLGMQEIKDLPSLLNLKPYEETYTTEIPLWDSGWVLLALVVLMGGEWVVRRRYDLP